ncbi:MAG: ArsR family transcriptional regulator [Ilumatobacter coccineus]|uniref:ArsR family transcriptional regulator n=1 Tax=Ilumatobacter coccineus TaxID=467094 RepID=A0A2G6K959_9ACTN|nr:MAG: ArsR family transcriptional regulator [Ilumatobacter coccineus]
MGLDRIDVAILRYLQNDGRMANKALARAVGLAPSSCLARVRRLIDDGVISRFGITLDRPQLGFGLEAMIAVRLNRHARDDIDQMIAHLSDLDETVSITHVAGATDLLVHVAVRDSDHLRDLVMDAFTTRSEVERFETSLIYSRLDLHGPIASSVTTPTPS